jgi:hypothetical protein
MQAADVLVEKLLQPAQLDNSQVYDNIKVRLCRWFNFLFSISIFFSYISSRRGVGGWGWSVGTTVYEPWLIR